MNFLGKLSSNNFRYFLKMYPSVQITFFLGVKSRFKCPL